MPNSIKPALSHDHMVTERPYSDITSYLGVF